MEGKGHLRQVVGVYGKQYCYWHHRHDYILLYYIIFIPLKKDNERHDFVQLEKVPSPSHLGCFHVRLNMEKNPTKYP